MIPTIKYNFDNMISIMFKMKTSTPSASLLSDLKTELNKFFKDSKCKEVIYTNNNDKLFFGMCVMPEIPRSDAYSILNDDAPYRIDSYYLEIDSKLFNPTLNLNARELTAIVLHEVGHVVKDSSCADELRKNMDTYLANNNEHIKITDSIHYKEILIFGIKDTIRKITSIFEKKDDEIIADEFVVVCGFGNELESAFDKIIKNGFNVNKNVSNKFVVFAWVLRLYKDVKLRRIPAVRSLKTSKQLSASRLEKREIENVISRLERIDDEALLEFTDSIVKKYKDSMRNINIKGMKSLENDLYEYNLRVNNTDFQDDTLVLLRQINIRISIIDEYVSTEKMSESEQKRWFDLLDKYLKLREDISKKSTYKDKYSRLYIEYPTINGEKVM